MTGTKVRESGTERPSPDSRLLGRNLPLPLAVALPACQRLVDESRAK
jgi:hypothetical protein